MDLILEESHTCYAGERGRRYDWGYGCGVCPACRLRPPVTRPTGKREKTENGAARRSDVQKATQRGPGH